MNDTNIKAISEILSGKQIAIVCGGGIGAIEMPRVARELRRHGATVQFFVTQKCLEFVGMTSLQWSSQNPVVVEPSGLSEHIFLGDAVLVAPATADILSQARYGLCANGATTLIQSAFGRRLPVGFIPTMHESMWRSPPVQENCSFLQTFENVFFITPRCEEHKEKMPDPVQLALTFAHYVNKFTNQNKKSVFLSFGGSRVMLDSVRCLSNLSTGKLGWETTKLFYGMGHETKALIASTNFEIDPLQDMQIFKYENYSDIYEFFEKHDFSSTHGIFHFLAASDYLCNSTKSKINSAKENITVHLKKAPKIRDLKNVQNVSYKFLCKLTSNDDIKSQMKVKKFMQLNGVQTLLWNTPDGAWNKENFHRGFLVTNHQNTFNFKSIVGKSEIAREIYQDFLGRIIYDF